MRINYSKVLGTGFALALFGASAFAQTGVGTTTPRTTLDVNGALAVAETTAAVTGNAATIPTGFSLVRLTGTATAAVALTAASAPVPVAGQLLTIYNVTAFAATFAGQSIAAGQTLSLVFSNGNWQATAGGPTTASNGLTKTASDVQLGGVLTQATAISGVTAANSLSVTSPTAADALLTIASTAGTGGGIVFGNPSHGVQRGFPVPGADNNVGLYTTAGSLYLSTTGRATGQFALTTAGNVGIGTASPATRLQVVSADNSVATNIADFQAQNLTQGVGFWYGGLRKTGSNLTGDLAIDSKSTGNIVLNANGGTGNVGIGTNTPNAPLQFNNSTVNRKLVLYETVNNDHQYYGLGINAGTLRYQVDGTSSAHVFYAGAGAAASNELFRVGGSGAIKMAGYGAGGAATGVVTTAPNAYLAVAADGTVVQTANGNAPNIYTVDGSIISDRTVTLNGHSINFLGSTGNFRFNSTGNTFSTSASSLLITQTGDLYGSSSIALRNRNGQNGLLVSTANQTTGVSQIGVTDLFLQTQSNSGTLAYKLKQMNLRLESRIASTATQGINYMVGPYAGTADTLEVQIGRPLRTGNGPGLVVGAEYAVAPLFFGVGSGGFNIGSRVAISPSLTESKITLFDGGTNPQAGAADATTHYGFGVSSGQLNYDVMNGGSHVFYTNSKNGSGTEIFRLASNGQARITSNLSGAFGLEVINNSTGAGGILVNLPNNANNGATFVQFRDGTTQLGNITRNGTGVSYNTTSDIRLKTSIVGTHYGLADVLKIGVKDYVYKADKAANPQTGFLAQQLYTIYPMAVTKGGDDATTNPWTVDYSKLTPLLTKAIQEQQAEIEALKTANASLKASLDGKASASTLDEMQAALQALRAEVQTLKAGAGAASASAK